MQDVTGICTPPSTHERMTPKSSCGRSGSSARSARCGEMKVQAPKSGQPYNPHSDSVKGSESVDRRATAQLERSLRFMSMARMTKNAETASTLVMTSASISEPAAPDHIDEPVRYLLLEPSNTDTIPSRFGMHEVGCACVEEAYCRKIVPTNRRCIVI